jgi:sirohydrochlorin cobaltochelatase
MLGDLEIADRDGVVVIKGPHGGVPNSAPAGRNEFRQWIRYDNDGRYRPLSGAQSLRAGWGVECKSVEEAAEWIEIVYPSALRHAVLRRRGSLNIVGAQAALPRQSGRYAGAGGVTETQIRRCADALCSQCVRAPVWLDGAEDSPIPCPEPCSVFIALAREAAHWGKEDIPGVQEARPPGFADFENASNSVRKRFFSQ